MNHYYLDKLFNPQSIAVIGASNKPLSVGATVLNNLLQNGFSGELYPVNPKYSHIQNQPCVDSVKNILKPVDLAIIVTPAATVPAILTECGEKKIHNVIILSAGFGESSQAGMALEHQLIHIAQQYHIRFIGPNCLGLMRPSIGLNATFQSSEVLPGELAFVSQSGALVAAILDWAIEENIGFSTIVSLGNHADLEFGEILDYLSLDSKTKCILLYIEGIHNARRFMSGLRAASRMKPVIVIKAGRSAQGLKAAVSHTGAMIGFDDVFDTALNRAGVVRVRCIKELFTAAEVFASPCRTKGSRLAIITNGGGAGVMAADCAADLKIELPALSQKTIIDLNTILPNQGGAHNPIDILGDATPSRYFQVVDACLKDDNCDAVLVILVPVAMSEPLKVAKMLVELNQQTHKPLLACWMGQKQVKSSWELFAQHHIPCFSTPETSMLAFSYLANFYHNQQLLLQVPDPIAYPELVDVTAVKQMIKSAIAKRRTILTTIESKAILSAFGIPVTQTFVAKTAKDALIAAESIGFPVVMKIHSPDITHKQDVGGVQLNITNAIAIQEVFHHLIERAKRNQPNAKIIGVTVERMYKTAHDRELMVGVLRDPVVGPVINFGAGGSLVEIMEDRALALPPLNQYLVKQLINRTHIARILGEFRHQPAVNIAAIENLLLRVSEMVCELPYIQEMDINPLIVNEMEIIAVDARIVVNADIPATQYGHMAIHPYPHHLVSNWQLSDGTLLVIRPIRPEDALAEQSFVRNLSSRSRHFRFMNTLYELSPDMLKKTTQIDYDREMALIAIVRHSNQDIITGIAQYVTNPDAQSCEFALVVADQWQKKGVGYHLMTCLMNVAKTQHLSFMVGSVLSSNMEMLELAKDLGFKIELHKDDPSMKWVRKLL